MVEPVVITGAGAVTPLGTNLDATWRAVLAGESAAHDWPDLAAEGFRAVRACRIADLPATATRRGRTLALTALAEALDQACLARPAGITTGTYIGSTLGESAAFEAAAAGQPIDLADHLAPSFCRAAAELAGATGPREAYATACAGGNYALAGALRALRSGRVKVALAGGVEPFSRLSMVGFSRSRAMAGDACRPFDRRRSGMLLGEGAAMFVLERESDARARGAVPLARLCGAGLSADAAHPTAPLADGSGMRQAMQAALVDAGIGPDAIGWISVHGSGTRASDAAEGRAIADMFTSGPPPLAGFKGALGHGLGAASAISAALVVRALQHRIVPPTAGFAEVDPAIGFGCTTAALPMDERTHVLANAFAFGGLNSAVVLAAA